MCLLVSRHRVLLGLGASRGMKAAQKCISDLTYPCSASLQSSLVGVCCRAPWHSKRSDCHSEFRCQTYSKRLYSDRLAPITKLAKSPTEATSGTRHLRSKGLTECEAVPGALHTTKLDSAPSQHRAARLYC